MQVLLGVLVLDAWVLGGEGGEFLTNFKVGMCCWDPGTLTRGTFHSTKIPVHSSCTDPTHTTAHFVIVLVRRIQESCTGDNNFVKWKGTFRSDQTR